MSLLATWQSLSLQNKIISAGAVVLTVLLFGMLLRKTTEPEMALLYAGLEPSAAGEVIAELESLGAAYEVRGETIYTDAARRDTLRFELARQGLPRQGGAGYELLDNLNSFAMTSEMFNTAYWRAKEGELARTISSLPSVRSVRVHIGTTKQSSFSRTPLAQTASVTVTTSNRLDRQQAQAIQYLTALAVSGLSPDDVAVIDTAHGVVAGPGMENGMMAGGMEMSGRAARMERALLSLLEARVGPGNARVNVSMDIDRERELISERVFDPESRVIKSRSANEVSESSSGTGPANVSVASNLPEGDGAQGSSNNSDRTETTETTEYEISEVRREAEKMPGTVTRMTVAVLLNNVITSAEDGTFGSEPRSDAELETLRELVAAAAGINADRGDVLTIKSLQFNTMPEDVDAVQAPGFAQQFLDTYLWSIIQTIILAAVVIILGLFVIKPLFTPQSAPLPDMAPLQITSDEEDSGFDSAALEMATVQVEEDPVDVMRGLTAEKPDDAATLLMSWLDEEKKVAS